MESNFNREHYEKIANVLKRKKVESHDHNIRHAIDSVIVAVADELERDSASFQRGRFYRGAGFYE
jgi:hypothetical protein